MQEKHIKYPLKFYPVLKQTLWGGGKIVPFLSLENERDRNGVAYSQMEHIGECWAVSAIDGFASVVSNGSLEGYSLPFLLGIYGPALVGKKNYERFGNEFPLLVKFIDAAQDLSVQVHPNDMLAAERHGCSGKTEMWYVLDAEKDARLMSGFAAPVSVNQYKKNPAKIMDALQSYDIAQGDMFYLPAGTVHSIGSGAFIAEIQQSSDITYRIYDYQRRDKNGNFRELHTELAADAIDFNAKESCKIEYASAAGGNTSVKNVWSYAVEVVSDKHFTTNIISLENENSTPDSFMEFPFDYSKLDSFVILTCTKGSCSLVYSADIEGEAGSQDAAQELTLNRGSVVLLPADMERVCIKVSAACELMETHI